MPASIQDPGRSMLKVAQFKEFSSGEKRIDSKYIQLILQELDLNFQVTSADLSGNNGKYLIGDTLLHIVYAKAYTQEKVDALNILIRKGADFNVKNMKGNTVLHTAFYDSISDCDRSRWNIFQNDLYVDDTRSQFITSVLSAQVEYKNKENPSDPDGVSHFHIACAANHVKAVEFFLKNGVSVDQIVTKAISKQDFKGYTGLHFAARFGCLRVIKILFEHGANVNLRDGKEKTPVHIALERNIAMIGSAEQFYSHQDIKKNKKIMHLLIDHNFDDKLSYLYIASSLRSTKKLENYLSQGIDVNQCMSMDSQNWPGYTALHFAAHVDMDMVKLLMKHGGNIETKDANGVTPFDMCIERYKAEDISDIICMVPKWKNIVLSDGKTTLIDLLLAFEDSDEIQNFLQKSDNHIDLFVPSNSPLWPGYTVLHVAVLLTERKKCKSDYKNSYFKPDLTVITEILKLGADVTVKDHRNWTPVHFAFQLGRGKVLDLLLQYHYRMQNPVDNDNLSHLHLACSVKNENFVERLLWNKVDVNIPYKGKTIYSNVFPGSTPLHIALFVGEEKIARLLLKFGADLHVPDYYSFTPVHFSMYEYCTTKLGNRIFSSRNLSDHVVEKVGLNYLHVACYASNLDAVRRLLDLGVDVNQRLTVKNLEEDSDYWKIWNLAGRDGDTPLHTTMSSSNCSSDVISLLIERGGDILVRNADGKSPLENILNYEYGNQYSENRVIVTALKRDLDLRRRVEVETGITLLHIACLLDGVDLIKELLDDGADVTAQIPKDKNFMTGYSPLHVAYEKLCLSTEDDLAPIVTQVSLLLQAQKEFNFNPTDEDTGISHFHIACHMLDIDVVEKFLEHNVDVNAAIDLFYNADIAGCSPWLLAIRTTKWRDNDSAKSLIVSSAKLKIVDLLIKHGARVNVEDIDGNTPAHYAASCSSKDENYLQLLADNGADVNTRNVQGKTPLELLIGKRNLKFEDIRYFIACGCIFNEFTLDTDEGFIALANTTLSQEDMESLLEETFLKYPDLMKRDCMNRTAIHNLVSTESYEISETELAALIDIMMRFDCDADDQDNLGRTALHLASRFRNDIAVKALLLVGADFSITDNNGKTPFAYMFDPCLCIMNKFEEKYHQEYGHSEMIDVFMSQVKKLEISNLAVDELNADLHSSVEYKFGFERMQHILHNFRSEFQQILQVKIKPYSIRLADFVGRADIVFDYPRMSEAKREAIDAFFKRNKNALQYRFSDAAGIFQLQYRQAVLRRKMMIPAKDSLSVLARFKVPDVCSDIIVRFLENSELRKLITSTTRVESKNADVESHGAVRNKKLRFIS